MTCQLCCVYTHCETSSSCVDNQCALFIHKGDISVFKWGCWRGWGVRVGGMNGRSISCLFVSLFVRSKATTLCNKRLIMNTPVTRHNDVTARHSCCWLRVCGILMPAADMDFSRVLVHTTCTYCHVIVQLQREIVASGGWYDLRTLRMICTQEAVASRRGSC